MSIKRFAKTTGTAFYGACVSAIFAAAAAPALAHHSSAMYDLDKSVTVTGTVKEFNWTNPHFTLVLDVPDAGNHMQTWDIEGGSPNTLVKRGFRRSIFKPGDKVTVTLHPMRNGVHGGIFLKAVVGDGSQVQ